MREILGNRGQHLSDTLSGIVYLLGVTKLRAKFMWVRVGPLWSVLAQKIMYILMAVSHVEGAYQLRISSYSPELARANRPAASGGIPFSGCAVCARARSFLLARRQTRQACTPSAIQISVILIMPRWKYYFTEKARKGAILIGILQYFTGLDDREAGREDTSANIGGDPAKIMRVPTADCSAR